MEIIDNEIDEPLYDVCNPNYVPSQGIYPFDSIRFFSNFDSGNLRKVTKKIPDLTFSWNFL